VTVVTMDVSAELSDGVNEQLVRQLVDRARAEGLKLTGEGSLLAQLTEVVVESALEGEMDDHLGYGKHDPVGRNGGNSRNGARPKTLVTEAGPVEIEVPRDRESSFEPRIVAKRQRRLSGIDDLVVSLSAKGLTTGEISAHLAEIYGAELSKQAILTSPATGRNVGHGEAELCCCDTRQASVRRDQRASQACGEGGVERVVAGWRCCGTGSRSRGTIGGSVAELPSAATPNNATVLPWISRTVTSRPLRWRHRGVERPVRRQVFVTRRVSRGDSLTFLVRQRSPHPTGRP
jgi:hypothetical protein